MRRQTKRFIDGYWQNVNEGEYTLPRKPKLTKAQRKKLYPKKRGLPKGYKFDINKQVKKDLKAYLDWGIKRRLKKHYSDKQLRIKKFIHLLGGTKEAMKVCGVTSFTTLSKWVEREAIPIKYYKKISVALEGKLTAGEIAKILISD